MPAAILSAGCILVFTVSRQQAMPLVRPLAAIPTAFSGYHVQDVKINESELQVAGVSDYVLRIFRRDTTPAFSV